MDKVNKWAGHGLFAILVLLSYVANLHTVKHSIDIGAPMSLVVPILVATMIAAALLVCVWRESRKYRWALLGIGMAIIIAYAHYISNYQGGL
jgi:peptidoglycan/LPS O-acetylase OafA/YrhL